MCDQPVLTEVQDVRGLAGALVYNCLPPILPVSIPLTDCGVLLDRSGASSDLAAASVDVTPGLSGSIRECVAAPGLPEAPPDDSGTDLEDEFDFVSVAAVGHSASGQGYLAAGVSGRLFGTSATGGRCIFNSTLGGGRAADAGSVPAVSCVAGG